MAFFYWIRLILDHDIAQCVWTVCSLNVRSRISPIYSIRRSWLTSRFCSKQLRSIISWLYGSYWSITCSGPTPSEEVLGSSCCIRNIQSRGRQWFRISSYRHRCLSFGNMLNKRIWHNCIVMIICREVSFLTLKNSIQYTSKRLCVTKWIKKIITTIIIPER